jgi:1-acyl-sn-glycerol-3-phosphate acyltransferase
MKQTSENKAVQESNGQIALLKSRRFGPFFATQFSGAFNDNLYKTALAVLLTYFTASNAAAESHLLVNLAAALFIAPFFLFSALAGQLADKLEKARLIRRIKVAEIAIMGCAGIALVCDQLWVLLALLFFMGAQSAFFGPVKYSLLPQHLKPQEIVGGNGMVEMGTFVAILLGTMTGGILIAVDFGRIYVALAVVLVAVVGFLVSRRIPRADAVDPGLNIRWNIFTETGKILAQAHRQRKVFTAMLGISWFWFLGAAYVTQLPNYVRQVLHCQAPVVTLLLALFSIGVAAGSLLCERLSGKEVELGLIPLGCLGMSLFGWDFAYASNSAQQAHLLGLGVFLTSPGSWRVLLDLTAIGVCGGLYIVPLFAFIQTRSPAAQCSRMIAANNVLNALFMVISSMLAGLLLGLFDLSLPIFFGVLAAGNLAVCIYILRLTPLFMLRLLVWAVTRIMYRVRCQGLEHIPASGPAVLVCNHVSYVDALIIAGSCRRPVRFVMHAAYYQIPVLRRLFRLARVIPIDSGKRNPTVLRRAMKDIDRALTKGELICLFPEGHLTKTGIIDTFRPGIERIIRHNPVPVVPLALRGLWGSFFSNKGGPAMQRRPRRFWSVIELIAGPLVTSPHVTAPTLQARVAALLGSKS